MTEDRDGARFYNREPVPERALVVHPDIAGLPAARPADAALAEAVGLTAAIDLDVRHSMVVGVKKVRPATLLGAGAVDEIKTICAMEEIDVVIVDCQLSPAQQRNLERAIDAKVIDRKKIEKKM